MIKFKSKGHILGHVGVAVAEGVGVAGLLYIGAAVNGPIGWGVAIGIHIGIALCTFIYDKRKEKKTLIKNIEDFKNSLEIQFAGNKDKIETIILNMKKENEKEIEKFVDSQK